MKNKSIEDSDKRTHAMELGTSKTMDNKLKLVVRNILLRKTGCNNYTICHRGYLSSPYSSSDESILEGIIKSLCHCCFCFSELINCRAQTLLPSSKEAMT